jgi:hypothetical protein
MNGSLDAHQTPGGGLTMTITLPGSSAAAVDRPSIRHATGTP